VADQLDFSNIVALPSSPVSVVSRTLWRSRPPGTADYLHKRDEGGLLGASGVAALVSRCAGSLTSLWCESKASDRYMLPTSCLLGHACSCVSLGNNIKKHWIDRDDKTARNRRLLQKRDEGGRLDASGVAELVLAPRGARGGMEP
jgi:hypothetical protein